MGAAFRPAGDELQRRHTDCEWPNHLLLRRRTRHPGGEEQKEGDAFTAKELWRNPENAVQFDSPVLKGGLIFGLSSAGKYFCIDAQTGKTDWAETEGSHGRFGSVVDAGSVLLGLTEKSTLIAFEPSDKQYTEVASIKVADHQTYAYPVLAGNRLFVKDQDSLTLWTIE